MQKKSFRRIIAVYCSILLMFTSMIFRIYQINASDALVETAGAQGRYVLDVAKTRGVIYDRNMRPMVNESYRHLAAVMPTVQATTTLLAMEDMDSPAREPLLQQLSGTTPFVLGLSHNDVYADGIDVFRIPRRYSEKQLAPHILGYLRGDGEKGVAGIEKAYDTFLAETGTQIKMRYQTDATGRVMKGGGVGVERVGEEIPVGGVVLTIDANIQKLAQNALVNAGIKGAAVVMDVYNGDILAMASLPAFDPNDIAASLESTEAPFINRATSGYNIGSAFKVIVAAAALESGVSVHHTHICTGITDINGVKFRCNFNAVHGEIDMERAMEVSCNSYFISLAREVSPAYLISVSRNLGLGGETELAAGMVTQPGNLPTAQELANEAAYANFSFGQGSSLASPLQMAQAIAAMANSGMAVAPRLVRGFTLDGVSMAEQTPIYSPSQVISERTASQVKALMTAVVEEGSGRTAKPIQGGAGGKTSSAQTGQLVDGEEIVHAWFTGFYPAKTPKYSIVVFAEGGESGEKVAAPVFKQIADGLSGLQKMAGQQEKEVPAQES